MLSPEALIKFLPIGDFKLHVCQLPTFWISLYQWGVVVLWWKSTPFVQRVMGSTPAL